jgi:hypothetical protein
MARKHEKRQVGDVLGLGGAAATPERNLPISQPHESAQEHRRRRMSEGADELTPSASAPHRSSGATGIDMGAGGDGTDLE